MDPNEIRKQQELLKLQRQLKDIQSLLERITDQNEKGRQAARDPILSDDDADYDPAEWQRIIENLKKELPKE